MIKLRLAVLSAAAASALAGPAAALPLDGASLQSRVPGAVIRVNYSGPFAMEDHVWRLRADGTIEAVVMRAPNANDHGGPHELGSGTGRWSVQGNELCVDVSAILTGRRACFSVETGPNNQVTLVGGNSLHVFRGTMTR